MQFVHNNYLRGSGAGPTWHVDIDAPSRTVGTYYQETVKAVEMIWAQRRGPMYLLYSGGLDSEYVLSVFLSLGMEITPVIMRLLPDYNQHDTKWAFEFCKSRGIDPLVIDLNFDDFVKSGKMLEIAAQAQSAAHQMPASLWLASQLDGTVVTGNDPPHMKLNQTDNLWYLDEEEVIHSQFRYWEKHNIYGTPFLLSYTPEQMLSFLLDPTMEKLANHGFPGKLGSNSTKVHVFNHGTDFNLVNRTKFTGYETIDRSEIFQHPDIQTLFEWRSKWFGTSDHQYHQVVQRLLSSIPK